MTLKQSRHIERLFLMCEYDPVQKEMVVETEVSMQRLHNGPISCCWKLMVALILCNSYNVAMENFKSQ